MSEEDLELLITLDDPGEDALEEDTFNHSLAGNTVAYRPGQPLLQGRNNRGAGASTDNDPKQS